MANRDDPRQSGLTSVKRRQLEASLAIDDTPVSRIAYQHTVLCQTCLPYRDPGDTHRLWKRNQGGVSLLVQAGLLKDPETHDWIEVGLPYGPKPRLILAHLNSEALKRSSPRIAVEDSLTAFVRRIQDRPPTGPEVRCFKEQLSRLAAAIVRFAIDSSDGQTVQVDTKIMDTFELWLTKDAQDRVRWPAVVELSPRYYDSLTRHAVPLDERAIAALANSALALDVYAWLAQRLHRIDLYKPQRITWQALHEQFGHGYVRLRKFRESFLAVLTAVQAHYPGAKLSADQQGMELRHSAPPVLCRRSPVIRSS